jgi:hypothetical protein
MDWDDILDDERWDDDLEGTLSEDERSDAASEDDALLKELTVGLQMSLEQLEHEQPLISRKETSNLFSVERELINSREYHEKFEALPVSKALQESLYVQSGRLLEFVDGLPEDEMGQERLLAVNFRTGEFLVDNFGRGGSVNRTRFNDEEMERIDQCRDSIAIIHNHSKSDIPSGQDLLTYLRNDKIKLSLIVCHNGDLYAICWVRSSFKKQYEEFLESAKKETTKMEAAKRLATTRIYRVNEQLSDRHKFFCVIKL